jgi:hypothetical protein
VISAQQLQPTAAALESRKSSHHDVVDPYVHVKVFGAPSDDASFTTRALDNNALDPYWNESTQFELLYPPLDLVQFLALDDDVVHDDFLGQAVVPFVHLQPGYHHIQLYDRDGLPKPNSYVFVRVAMTPLDPICVKQRLIELAGEEAPVGLTRKQSSRRGRRRSSLRVLISSTCELATTGVQSIDDTFERCKDVVGELGRLKQEVESAHREFLSHAGAKATDDMTTAMRNVVKHLDDVKFTVREVGKGVYLEVSGEKRVWE